MPGGAVAVREAISDRAASTARPLLAPLTLGNIWLAVAPEGLHPGVWDVVALVAVAAMDSGRRHMYTRCLLGEAAGPALGLKGACHAARTFGELLHDFASLGRLPLQGAPPLSPGVADPLLGHPLLCRAAPGATTMRVTPPCLT